MRLSAVKLFKSLDRSVLSNVLSFCLQVFQAPTCPGVLLLDETMAALDPSSKTIVMSKLKEFCAESIVLVIYHGDSIGEDEDACVQSNNFFDSNLHLDNGNLILRSTC